MVIAICIYYGYFEFIINSNLKLFEGCLHDFEKDMAISSVYKDLSSCIKESYKFSANKYNEENNLTGHNRMRTYWMFRLDIL